MKGIFCMMMAEAESATVSSQEMEMIKALSFNEFIDKLVSMVVTFTINLCIALVVFFLGKYIIGKIYHLLATIFLKRNIDKSLSTFILSLIRILLYFILTISVVGILGIETSSFLAIFASASVAIGLAFTGTLQNFAGGVLILLLKPYKVGDYIEVGSYAGTVKEIQIFNTIITTADNKSIIIPNGGLSTGSINNYSREKYRRVDWTVGISYGDNVDTARKVILDLLLSDDRIVKQYIEDQTEPEDDTSNAHEQPANQEAEKPKKRNIFYRLFTSKSKKIRDAIADVDATTEKKLSELIPKVDRSPAVHVKELADSSVNLTVRAWTRNSDYWSVYFKMNELFYNTLPQHNIHFPFPQMDVHVQQQIPE
ncbi:MAG: mechanosensitive ion channel [Muribaculaceae bacterium]|nr:mechanosensitive ion channel [Muribaculaceae bacterium]